MVVIKFFVLNGLSQSEIYPNMIRVNQENAPSFSTVKNWASVLKCSRTLFEDGRHEGRPKTANTDYMIKKIHNITVLDDWRQKVYEISQLALQAYQTSVLNLREPMLRNKIIFKAKTCFVTIRTFHLALVHVLQLQQYNNTSDICLYL